MPRSVALVALLGAGSAAAFSLRTTSSAAVPSGVRTRLPPLVCVEEPPPRSMTWQEGLERLLSPTTASGDRQVLFNDLLGRGSEIAGDITNAVSTGDLKSLVPPETEGGRTLADMESVRRQVVDDLLPDAASKAQSYIADPAAAASKLGVQDAAQAAPRAVSSLLQDPARLYALVQQEAKNAVSRTPEGLELPSYQVVSRASDYEVREYLSCSVALTSLDAGAESSSIESEASIKGFNSLAAYIFGGNAGGETLEWTAPVRIDVSDDDGFGEFAEMSIMLPRRYTSSTAPAPVDENVFLRQ